MDMSVQTTHNKYEHNTMLIMRGSDAGLPKTFDIGTSASKFYTGHDNATAEASLPSFGVTHAADKVVADAAITVGATVEEVSTRVVALTDLPPWLQTADTARPFLLDMQPLARRMGRILTRRRRGDATAASPNFP